jgi:hypothetical protein
VRLALADQVERHFAVATQDGERREQVDLPLLRHQGAHIQQARCVIG